MDKIKITSTTTRLVIGIVMMTLYLMTNRQGPSIDFKKGLG